MTEWGKHTRWNQARASYLLPTTSVQPQHCLTHWVPPRAYVQQFESVASTPHDTSSTTKVSGCWQSPGTAHVTGLSRCHRTDSQCVINPSCTPKSEIADSLCRHSGRDELISLSEALLLSSCWDWIYEHLALHPRQ